MKKRIIISIILITVLCFVTGCGKSENRKEETQAKEILEKSSKNNKNKILVVYFSKTGENYNVGKVKVGNTAMVASYIKEYLDADSFEIIPAKAYPESYDETKEIADKERRENARPAIKNDLENLEKYDTIFIGYPIWIVDLPMIMYTFLEKYDFSGKTVIPFNTHGGSGNAGTYNTIKSLLANSNVNTNGLAVIGNKARSEEGKEETINWLKSLGY